MTDQRVVNIFNDMQEDYDQINDLWYSWLFSRLHLYIAKKVINRWKASKRVLDIGCGTGFQSFLYASGGATVNAIDISDKLIHSAHQKNRFFNPHDDLELFEPKFGFVKEHNKKINAILRKSRKDKTLTKPVFEVGDAEELHFADATFDHINCCGSTLSFVTDYPKAIREMNRCLKIGGTFVLEVESKNNPDLLWTLLDATVFRGKLEFETSFKEARSQLFGRVGDHIQVEYPFGNIRNPVYMNITLFQRSKLRKELRNAGFVVQNIQSIHAVTNLIPSTLLDSQRPGKLFKFMFNALASVEEMMPLALPGCSLVIFGKKER